MGLKVGVIGVGLLGKRHCINLQKNEHVSRLVACDLSQDTLEDAKASTRLNGGYLNHEEMLYKEDLDVVIVATPDSKHYEPVMDSIEAGIKHIICEKPLSTNPERAERMVRNAEKKESQLYVLFANRFLSVDMGIKHCLSSNLIGRPVFGEVRLDNNITVPTTLWGNQSKEWIKQSSPAHFLLSHVIDLLRWYFSPAEITKVYAISQKDVLGYSVDLYDSYLIFDNGMKARIKSEWIKCMDELIEFYLSFTGENGTMIYNKMPGYKTFSGVSFNLSCKEDYHKLDKCYETLRTLGLEVNLIRKANGRLPYTIEIIPGDIGEEWDKALDYFIDGIVEDTSQPSSWSQFGPLPNGEDGLKAVKVACAIEESAEQGKAVEIS